jgi:uncharacterized SAM-binding protein YcdF (DUF218 family)
MLRPVLRPSVVVLSCLGLAYLAAAAWLDQRGKREPPEGTFDAIVVLGCRVRPDGTASGALARRARHAAHLYAEGIAPKVVFTGGVGDFPPSEASAAAAIARGEGVPDEVIVLEETSTSTEENAREASRLIGGGRVLVVTDTYHAFRAERVFARHFESAVAVGRSGTGPERARGALREVGAVTAYAVLGRL